MKFKWSTILEHLDHEPEQATRELEERARLRDVWERLERLGQSLQDMAVKEQTRETDHGH